jgi:hypothetical protein
MVKRISGLVKIDTPLSAFEIHHESMIIYDIFG